MFCPKCAAPNSNGVKFCRKCGMDLEAVALVLGDLSAQQNEVGGKRTETHTSQDWLNRRSEAVKEISTGVSLLVVSVLIAMAMAFFVPSHIPWILTWVVLVGWMACWGGIGVGNGIAGLLEAKNRIRLPRLALKDSAGDSKSRQLASASQPPMVRDPSGLYSPSSVTEGTTRELDDLVER